jgi:hypothetical protein
MKNTLLRKALTTSGVTLALIPLVLAANATLFQVSAVRFIGPPVPVTPPITPVTPPQASPSLSPKNSPLPSPTPTPTPCTGIKGCLPTPKPVEK